MNRRNTILLAILASLSCIISLEPAALAQTAEEKQYLLMYFREEELVAESATRVRKSLSRTAENISIVTADDIRLMNAHTVADVLNTVTGVAVFQIGGPGSMAAAHIQGSEQRHVTVMLDGVVLNNLGGNIAELGSIPVQMIEKIEIIKGPASSAWGSALGGVVNIITKSEGREEGQGGMLSASYGTKRTSDLRAEARGRHEGFGYYLTAGRFTSDGFARNMDVFSGNVYAKLTYDLSDRTGLIFTTGYASGRRGDSLAADYDMSFYDIFRRAFSTLTVNAAMSGSVGLSLSLRTLSQSIFQGIDQLSTGLLLAKDDFLDTGKGATAKATWKGAYQTVVLGTDYDSRSLQSNTIAGEQGLRKWAVFVNDTIVLDRFSITPGMRYERTNTNGDVTSPSIGITYRFAQTILRASAARGFSIPDIGATYGTTVFYTPNPDLKPEKVHSYQIGAETTALQYLWLKVTAFRHEIRDAITLVEQPDYTMLAVNSERQRRQGIEAELRTTPVYNTSLSAGAELVDARDLGTGERLHGIPTRVYDLALRYDDRERAFKALVQGRSIDWNSFSSDQGKNGSFIFDLHASKTVYEAKTVSLDAYASVHNIFNRDQYQLAIYPNPGRWYEAGARCAF